MPAQSSIEIHRHDYAPPDYQVEAIDIGFDLDPDATRVLARMTLARSPGNPARDIHLHGNGLKLTQLRMNGRRLGRKDFTLESGDLRIFNAPDTAILEIETHIRPAKNTSLMGLYVSGGNFFTQCEAEGFRKITFFPDRPDVMTKFTVMLRADKKKYPVLLSNGNLIEKGNLGDGRHYAKWEDPFRKPSYLFALVAGKFVCREEKFRVKSGREVLLQVWVEKGNLDKTQHAMDSLKHSICWDEERFGLELDLDRFMIVAVGDFNMGAMENKGLNIFNTKFVLANPKIATDADYANIEAVVAHEYFHNWTGNRVTCQDWFQLSLKEGLTVFRDQEFSADMIGSASGRAVKRIEDVRALRQMQFPEDAGPMAHPVRPDSFVEINNFYTVTIYEKGAEVVRMLQTLLGREGFRKGMDMYFHRHDGQAVQCDDFRAAMADANGRDLSQFERWYSQAGTPRVEADCTYDAEAKTFSLTLTQSCPPTPGQAKKLPFHIPVAVGLIGSDGRDLPLHLGERHTTSGNSTMLLELTEKSHTFIFTSVPENPTPSVLRGFSAPVILDIDYTDADLAHLLAHDSDHFNRWEAGQRLMMRRLLALTTAVQNRENLSLDPMLIDALRASLKDETLDPAFRELVMTLPSETMIAEAMTIVDPQAISAARRFMRETLAREMKSDFLDAYEACLTTSAYHADPISAGKRSLKNLALSYLLAWADDSACDLALAQIDTADNMTDRLAALTGLVNAETGNAIAMAEKALRDFYRDFKNEPLVIDKWFTLQATAHTCTVDTVRKLMRHPAFSLTNPNRARSLIFTFCSGNPARFHDPDGSAYALWAEQLIAIDAINPQLAARLARMLDRWRKFTPSLQEKMEATLKRVALAKNLSRDVKEIIGKSLAA